ncbi:MAG: phage terminase large subunit [Phreatobacter sp.]|uniref:phage terminase large subunit n=1 Tax=Phreatobacter sp. TaxID=1966341 RepID=UPI001A4D01E1|nr:phage terminase large subunit [Phreatobacter sp.]MBL8571973.1 phage terminase large subunit [Phreatobacter sp.]
MSDRLLLQALLLHDLGAFTEKVFRALEPGQPYLHNWHLDHIAEALARVERGELKRLIINVPPRSLKSILVSVAFSAWVLGRDPRKRIMCISYAEDLARKHALDTRKIVDEAWYREIFRDFEIPRGRARDLDFGTTLNGYRFAAGMGGAITGRGADIILIDDPIKPADALSKAMRRRAIEYYDGTLQSRLNNKREGAIVIVMQRLHEDDLVAHVTQNEDWEVISLPAIATEPTVHRLSDDPSDIYHRAAGEVLHAEREPREILEALRRSMGSLIFSAQYQQAPVPPEGNIVKRDWLRRYETRPETFDLVVASWDTASTIGETSDYSVGTVWGAKGLDYYLLDLVRGRFEVPDLRRRLVALSTQWSANATLVEETDIGRAIVQELRITDQLRCILRPPRFDKEARILAQSARFESGQVHVPSEATWLAEWLSELLAFPNGRHDDQVDSTSQALHYLTVQTAHLKRAEIAQTRPARERPARMARPKGYRRNVE